MASKTTWELKNLSFPQPYYYPYYLERLWTVLFKGYQYQNCNITRDPLSIGPRCIHNAGNVKNPNSSPMKKFFHDLASNKS